MGAEPLVQVVPPSALVTDEALVKAFDLSSMSARDADFSAKFELLPRVPPAAGEQGQQQQQRGQQQGQGEEDHACVAVVVWFDVHFSERFCAQRPVTLTTSPHAPATHWAQTVLVLR